MTTVSILPEPAPFSGAKFRAVAGRRQSVGKTPGEALDALSELLGDQESGTLCVIQQMKPDRFFTEAQRTRMADLMGRWRTARDAGATLPPDDQVELDQLVAAELNASALRATALLSPDTLVPTSPVVG